MSEHVTRVRGDTEHLAIEAGDRYGRGDRLYVMTRVKHSEGAWVFAYEAHGEITIERAEELVTEISRAIAHTKSYAAWRKMTDEMSNTAEAPK